MTTTIKITSHNYPALIETWDGDFKPLSDSQNIVVSRAVTDKRIIFPEDGEITIYCTTNRQIRVRDLEYDDPAVLAEKDKRLTK